MADEAPTLPPEDDRQRNAREALAQRLWGDGYLSVGAPFIASFLNMLRFTAANSTLNIGAGLGGATREIHALTDAWVTGVEADPVLAERAMERSKQLGVARHAAVKRFNPEAPKFPGRGYDAIFAVDAFYPVRRKEELFAAMAPLLKVDGRLLFVDLTLGDATDGGAALKRWYAGERIRPHLWTAARIAEVLKKQRLHLVRAEDITQRYRTEVMQGWMRFLSETTRAQIVGPFADVLVAECAAWFNRIKAMETGGLRAYWFDAERLPT
jgi:cyclopropane fatty-acyl-phospholipid synthase-like methyltransferase